MASSASQDGPKPTGLVMQIILRRDLLTVRLTVLIRIDELK
jgi:hypothetical protein